MKKWNLKLRLFLVAALFSISSCATQSVQEFKNSSLYDDDAAFMGEMTALMIRSQFGLAANPLVWTTAQEVLGRLSAGLKKNYRIFIVDAQFSNAFALPNEQIVVTSGLLNQINSEDELAGVIAHEISHVELGHYRKRLERMNYGVGGMNMFLFMFDQKEELEADRNAIKLLVKARYHTDGLLEHFKTFQAFERREDIKLGGFGMSHPSLKKRAEEYEKAAVADATGKEQPSRQSGRSFIAMRRSIYEDHEKYQPNALAEEEVPRFKSGDSEFDRELGASYAMFRTGIDLVLLRRSVEKLLKRSGIQGKKKAAVLALLARIDLAGGRRLDDAGRELDEAEKEWPGIESVPWLRFHIDAVLHGRASVKDKWHERFYSDACQRSLECIRIGALMALGLLDNTEEMARAARIFRETWLKSQGIENQDIAGLSAALSHVEPAEIWENLKHDNDDRDRDRKMPAGFTSSKYLADWAWIERDMISSGRSWGYSEHGIDFYLLGGYSGTAGPVSEKLGSGGSPNLGIGWRFWPWEIGMNVAGVFNSQLYKDSARYDDAEIGLYLRRDWNKNRLRTWSRGSVCYVFVENGSANHTISKGFALAAESGITYRLTKERKTLGLGLVAGVGLRYLRIGNGDGNSGNNLRYDVVVGLELLVSNNIQKDLESSNPHNLMVRKPREFF